MAILTKPTVADAQATPGKEIPQAAAGEQQNEVKKRSSTTKSEPIGTSVIVLLVGLALSSALVWLFDQSPARRVFSRKLEAWIWAVPPYAFAVVPCVLYVACVWWHLFLRSEESKEAAKARTQPENSCINTLLVTWNYAMTVMSMLLFMSMLPFALVLIWNHGGIAYVCDGALHWDETPEGVDLGLYAKLMVLSKFPELLDTAFLVVRGRDVPFLHWYHHTSVLLYCWLTVQTGYPSATFGLVNAGVHSIMYYYYARAAQGVRLGFAKFVTQIQITQMVFGIAASALLMGLHYGLPEGRCTGGRAIQENGMLSWAFLATTGMYLSYLVLFVLFYIKRYHKKKSA